MTVYDRPSIIYIYFVFSSQMLADDEPSLEYLRSGMKNLLSLLSHEYDIPELKELTTSTARLVATTRINEDSLSDELNMYKLRSKLPNARSLSVLIRDHQKKFVKLNLDGKNLKKTQNQSIKCLFENFSAAYDKISEDIDMELPLSGSKYIGHQVNDSFFFLLLWYVVLIVIRHSRCFNEIVTIMYHVTYNLFI